MPGEIDDLAGALADGEHIDWDAARKRLTSPAARTIADSLESISRISAVAPALARPSRRLPWILEIVTIFAAARCVAGVVGYAAETDARGAFYIAIIVTFAATALFLDLAARDRRGRALALVFWTTAATFTARGVLSVRPSWPALRAALGAASFQAEAFFAAAVWQFARDFPRITRFSRLDDVCRWGGRVALAMGLVLFGSSVAGVVAPASALAVILAPLRRSNGMDSGFWFVSFSVALAGLAVMAFRSRWAQGSERIRVRLFLSAVVFAFAPITSQVVLLILVPPYLQLVQASPPAYFWSSVAVYAPMLLLPVATAYAVGARDVLNVRLVIQRGLRYLLARWLLVWGALVPLALLLWHLYRHSNVTLSAALAMEPAPTLLWFGGAGAIVFAFRGTLIRALDEWVLPGIEEPAVALAATTERMKTARTPLEVASVLSDGIGRSTQAPSRLYLIVDGVLVPSAAEDATLPMESALPALLEGAREPVMVACDRRQSYYSLLLETDRAWIDREHVEVIVPVVTARAGGGLLAAVALSSRRNALQFTDDDMRFLRAAAAAASLACDAIVTETDDAGRRGLDALEEMALQCPRCGRIEGWSNEGRQCSCGGRWERAALPKRVHDRFDLREWLGAGGMGVVYRAVDLTLGRDVAVKTLPQLSDDAAERLMGEARAMASLSHGDVAVLYEVVRWRRTPLLVMEYLPGGTLSSRLHHDTRPTHAELIALVRVLAGMLGRVHGRGVFHGDVKPGNIGFAIDGTPRLLDFGLARALTHALDVVASDQPNARVGGTWAYLSPEVRDGGQPGPMLDLWALAVVLCEGLLGEHPFRRARAPQEFADARAIALDRLKATCSPAHRDVMARLLALDPTLRPATAAGFDDLLASL